ncbi:histone deacetylase HDT1 [Cornus florida]|uniref:histone deacetylase HDT1 n=1 Tax=Cornus florida TaxID=4283 RepID=UPI00289A4DC3|nr:histone deacetylase HDT1 [Cornus florida]
MEFWGVEVKSGNPVSVVPGDGKVLHLSQACLGEVNNKGNEYVCLFLNIDGQKHVIGTLNSEKLPQQVFDLVFEKEFELSHNWKNGSVYFIGYKAENPFDNSDEEDGSDSDDDILPVAVDNGKAVSNAKEEKPAAAEKVNTMSKQKVKIVEPNKDEKPKEDDDSSDESDESETGETDSDEDSEDDESDDESDEETPKKVEIGKKRAAESASKTPGTDKKAKLVTPQKTDGKKSGGHVATPHPSKQAGKTPANQPKQQTPKSAGSHPCKTCNKSFNSDQALQSHTKAKHSAAK